MCLVKLLPHHAEGRLGVEAEPVDRGTGTVEQRQRKLVVEDSRNLEGRSQVCVQ